MALPSPDVSPSARNYESLHAMAKSGYLLALAQRSSLDFIFKALLGTIENCTTDFQESQSFSKMHEEKCLLLQRQLDDKNSELSQHQSELLSIQQKLQISQNHELFYRKQAQSFGACPSSRRLEFPSGPSAVSDPQLMRRISELNAILAHHHDAITLVQSENSCLHIALENLIASSISQYDDSVTLLEQTVLLSSAHQIVRDNLVICELENIRLAGTAASTCAADPLHFEATSATILSRADLQALFSTLDLSSPSKSRCLVPLNSSVLAVLNAGLAKRWRCSYFERELLSKIHAGRHGKLGNSFDQFERWYHFDYGSVAGHIPGRIPRSPSALVFLPPLRLVQPVV